jgi:cyclophilin family peptidyl-prolyl cis-trans isomerase
MMKTRNVVSILIKAKNLQSLAFRMPCRTYSRSISAFDTNSPPPPPPPEKEKVDEKQEKANNSEQKSSFNGTKVAFIFLLSLGLGYFGPNLLEMNKETPSKTKAENDELAAIQGKVTDRVFLDVQIDNKVPERIVIGLYGDECPKTVLNFKSLCEGFKAANNRLLTYKNCPVHRIIPGFMMQSGDYTTGDGTGGQSIYESKYFPDESFKYQHTGPGVVSMANRGPNTNTSQFFICFEAASWLNGRHVVFGQVMYGLNTLRKVEENGNRSGKPSKEIKIVDCGLLPKLEESLVTNNNSEELDEMGHNSKRIMK